VFFSKISGQYLDCTGQHTHKSSPIAPDSILTNPHQLHRTAYSQILTNCTGQHTHKSSPIAPDSILTNPHQLHRTAYSQILTNCAITVSLKTTQSKLLTLCLRLIFDKLTVHQPSKPLPTFYEALSFAAELTTARQPSLS